MAKDNKRVAEEEVDVGSGLKRVKYEPGDISWEWENDGQVWTSFSAEHTKIIDECFNSGLQKMDMIINDLKFNIVFERMAQRNSKTYWERRIRASKNGDDGGLSGTCQFKDDNGKWMLYDHSAQRLLHAANLYGLGSVNLYTKGQRYRIDLDNKEQYNIKTKKSIKIRLQAIDDDDDDEESVKESTSEAKKAIKSNLEGIKTERNIETKNGVTPKNIDRKKTKSKSQKKKEEPEEKEVTKHISIKGKAPVDDECFVKEKYHVYYEGKNVYDAMLNQTNLKNNNNKFYLMQILQTNANNGYAVWFRWGRVGMVGQSSLTSCGNDLEKAMELFCKKFYDKTKNEFSDRQKFKKVAGKYDLLFMDYKSTEKDVVDAPVALMKQKSVPPSNLDKKLQDLIELLCNVKDMEEAVLEMKYDAKKAPLGKLTKQQIKNGYKALQKIEQCISNNKMGDELIKACDAFYTRVPHSFGMQRLPVIRTKQELKQKIELLETLGDIEIAMKVINEASDSLVNPIDQHYSALNCGLNALDHNSDEFKILNKYTQNTHAKTHNQYKMEIIDVFEVSDPDQIAEYNDVGNRMLLWHGSRLTNFVGILSQGLRVAPPEAPVTGYMFGKGIYFADISSKSANYCYPTRSKNIGFTLLCEVSLGKTHDLLAADYEADKLPDGFHSTKGLGKIAPDISQFDKLSDGVIVPCGLPTDTGVDNPDGYTLNYNEFVVYDTKQVKSRYLVKLKFNFN